MSAIALPLNAGVDVDFSDEALMALIRKFDEFIVQLADRLSKPDKGLFGASGEPDADCLKGLTYLNKAVALRNIVVRGILPFVYTPTEATNSAAAALGKLFAPPVSMNVVPELVFPPGMTGPAQKMILYALAGISALSASPLCGRHERIDNFAKNTASKPGPGMLGVEKFKKDAITWISGRIRNEAEIAELLEKAGIVVRIQKEEAAATSARLASLQARLNALKKQGGGYRKTGKWGRVRRIKTKTRKARKSRRHH